MRKASVQTSLLSVLLAELPSIVSLYGGNLFKPLDRSAMKRERQKYRTRRWRAEKNTDKEPRP